MTSSRSLTPQRWEAGVNTFNLRSTRAGSGYGQGQRDQGERPAGFLALGWIGGLGRIAVASFGLAWGGPARARLPSGHRSGPPPRTRSLLRQSQGGRAHTPLPTP